MSSHDLNSRPGQTNLVNLPLLGTDSDKNVALTINLDSLRDLIPNCPIRLHIPRGKGKVRRESAGRAPGSGILEALLDHARADGHGAGRLADAHEVVAPEESPPPAWVESLVHGERGGAAGHLGEKLDGGELDENEGHSVDDAENGGGEFSSLDFRDHGKIPGSEGVGLVS